MIDYYKKYLKYKNKYLNYKKKYLLKGGNTTFLFGINTPNCTIIKAMILDYWHDNPLMAGKNRDKTFAGYLGETIFNTPVNIKITPDVQDKLKNRKPLGGSNHDNKKASYFMSLYENDKINDIFKLMGATWENHFGGSNPVGVFYAFDQANCVPVKIGKCTGLDSDKYLGDGFGPITFDKVLLRMSNITEYIDILNAALTISFFKRYGFLDNCFTGSYNNLYHFMWAEQLGGNQIVFNSYCLVLTPDTAPHDAVSPKNIPKLETTFAAVKDWFCIDVSSLDGFNSNKYIKYRHIDTNSCSITADLFNIFLSSYPHFPTIVNNKPATLPGEKAKADAQSNIEVLNEQIKDYNTLLDAPPGPVVALPATMASAGGAVNDKKKQIGGNNSLNINSISIIIIYSFYCILTRVDLSNDITTHLLNIIQVIRDYIFYYLITRTIPHMKQLKVLQNIDIIIHYRFIESLDYGSEYIKMLDGTQLNAFMTSSNELERARSKLTTDEWDFILNIEYKAFMHAWETGTATTLTNNENIIQYISMVDESLKVLNHTPEVTPEVHKNLIYIKAQMGDDQLYYIGKIQPHIWETFRLMKLGELSIVDIVEHYRFIQTFDYGSEYIKMLEGTHLNAFMLGFMTISNELEMARLKLTPDEWDYIGNWEYQAFIQALGAFPKLTPNENINQYISMVYESLRKFPITEEDGKNLIFMTMSNKLQMARLKLTPDEWDYIVDLKHQDFRTDNENINQYISMVYDSLKVLSLKEEDRKNLVLIKARLNQDQLIYMTNMCERIEIWNKVRKFQLSEVHQKYVKAVILAYNFTWDDCIELNDKFINIKSSYGVNHYNSIINIIKEIFIIFDTNSDNIASIDELQTMCNSMASFEHHNYSGVVQRFIKNYFPMFELPPNFNKFFIYELYNDVLSLFTNENENENINIHDLYFQFEYLYYRNLLIDLNSINSSPAHFLTTFLDSLKKVNYPKIYLTDPFWTKDIPNFTETQWTLIYGQKQAPQGSEVLKATSTYFQDFTNEDYTILFGYDAISHQHLYRFKYYTTVESRKPIMYKLKSIMSIINHIDNVSVALYLQQMMIGEYWNEVNFILDVIIHAKKPNWEVVLKNTTELTNIMKEFTNLQPILEEFWEELLTIIQPIIQEFFTDIQPQVDLSRPKDVLVGVMYTRIAQGNPEWVDKVKSALKMLKINVLEKMYTEYNILMCIQYLINQHTFLQRLNPATIGQVKIGPKFDDDDDYENFYLGPETTFAGFVNHAQPYNKNVDEITNDDEKISIEFIKEVKAFYTTMKLYLYMTRDDKIKYLNLLFSKASNTFWMMQFDQKDEYLLSYNNILDYLIANFGKYTYQYEDLRASDYQLFRQYMHASLFGGAGGISTPPTPTPTSTPTLVEPIQENVAKRAAGGGDGVTLSPEIDDWYNSIDSTWTNLETIKNMTISQIDILLKPTIINSPLGRQFGRMPRTIKKSNILNDIIRFFNFHIMYCRYILGTNQYPKPSAVSNEIEEAKSLYEWRYFEKALSLHPEYYKTLIYLYMFDFRHKCEGGPTLPANASNTIHDWGKTVAQELDTHLQTNGLSYNSFKTFLDNTFFARVRIFFQYLKKESSPDINYQPFFDACGYFIIMYFHENTNGKTNGRYINSYNNPYLQIIKLYKHLDDEKEKQHALITLLQGLKENIINFGTNESDIKDFGWYKYVLYATNAKKSYIRSALNTDKYNWDMDKLKDQKLKEDRELEETKNNFYKVIINTHPNNMPIPSFILDFIFENDTIKTEFVKKFQEEAENHKHPSTGAHIVDPSTIHDISSVKYNTAHIANYTNPEVGGVGAGKAAAIARKLIEYVAKAIKDEICHLTKWSKDICSEQNNYVSDSIETGAAAGIASSVILNGLAPLPSISGSSLINIINWDTTKIPESIQVTFQITDISSIKSQKLTVVKEFLFFVYDNIFKGLYKQFGLPLTPEMTVEVGEICSYIDSYIVDKKSDKLREPKVRLMGVYTHFFISIIKVKSQEIYTILFENSVFKIGSFYEEQFDVANYFSQLEENLSTLSYPVDADNPFKNIRKNVIQVGKEGMVYEIPDLLDGRFYLYNEKKKYYFWDIADSGKYKFIIFNSYWLDLLTHFKSTYNESSDLLNRINGDFFENNTSILLEIINYHKFSGDQLQRLICTARGFYLQSKKSEFKNIKIENGLFQGSIGSIWFTQDKSTTFGAFIEIARCLKNMAEQKCSLEKQCNYLRALPIIIKPICSKHPIGSKTKCESNPKNLYICTKAKGISNTSDAGIDVKHLHKKFQTEWDNVWNVSHIYNEESTKNYYTGNVAFDFSALIDDADVAKTTSKIGQFIAEVLNPDKLHNLLDMSMK
jgi:hypothetical protein